MSKLKMKDLADKYAPAKQVTEGQSTAMKRKMDAQRKIENRRIDTEISKDHFEHIWDTLK